MAYRVDQMRAGGYCIHLPDGIVRCDSSYCCDRCQIADRIERNTGRAVYKLPLFGWRDALPQTPSKKGETWYGLPVILSPEVMVRLGLEQNLKNQIVIAVGGPGVFKKNPCGEIDGLLYADFKRRVTVTRNECYGLPTARACEIYDRYFSRFDALSLVRYFEPKRRDGH